MPRPKFIEDFSTRYGVSRRTIKRWRQVGRIKGDAINLDSPAEVLAWWERNMEQRPTLGILEAAVAAGVSPSVSELIPRDRRELPEEPLLFEIARSPRR